MKIRIARHTNNLKNIISFYTDLIGLEILGSFTDHDGYDGVFLGMQNSDWHLEFTVSNEIPTHHPDEDDLLVFYTSSENEYLEILDRFLKNGIPKISAKNPYWNENGSLFIDPDKFRVVISK